MPQQPSANRRKSGFNMGGGGFRLPGEPATAEIEEATPEPAAVPVQAAPSVTPKAVQTVSKEDLKPMSAYFYDPQYRKLREAMRIVREICDIEKSVAQITLRELVEQLDLDAFRATLQEKVDRGEMPR